jgi:cell wall-associated NlpC family hydrolase
MDPEDPKKKKMTDTATEFVEKSKGKNPASTPANPKKSESYGGVGGDIKPGESTDCVSLVRSTYKAATGKDLYSIADPQKSVEIAQKNGQMVDYGDGKKGPSGVPIVAAAGTEIPLNQVKEGDVLIFGNYSHIALATGNVVTDDKGNTISVTVAGSQSSTGPAFLNIRMDKSGSYENGNSGYWSPLLKTAYRLPGINEDSSSDK